MKKRSVTEFFKQDKPAHSSYDNLRKIPSYIDGLKVSQRKLIWTAFAKASKEYVKTETFVNLAALYIRYRNENELLATADDPECFYIETVMPDKLRINLQYVNNHSFMGDIGIIMLTLRAVFTN